MAGDKSKKRAEKNTARLKLLFRTVAGSVLFHVLLRLVWKGSTASAWIHYPLFATAATSSWFCYSSLNHHGAPTYDPAGNLIDGGSDLGLGGMTSYSHDIIYVSAFVLITTAAFSDWFWLIALIIPGFATYKLWADIILPWIFTPTQDEMERNARMKETKEERRKREKKEAKAENRRRGFR